THTLAARPQHWYMGAWFSPDGKLVFTYSYGRDRTELAVWDVQTGERLREAGGVGAHAFAVSPDGRQLAAGGGKFELWDVQTLRRLSAGDNQYAFAAALHLSPAGDRVVTVGYESVSTWDGRTGRRL